MTVDKIDQMWAEYVATIYLENPHVSDEERAVYIAQQYQEYLAVREEAVCGVNQSISAGS